MKKKFWLGLLVMMVILIAVSFFVPQETQPPSDTRVVLEHNRHTYIAPPCFENANPTNWLEEATLEEAENLTYPPDGSCTEEAMESEESSLFVSLLKDLGILERKWDW